MAKEEIRPRALVSEQSEQSEETTPIEIDPEKYDLVSFVAVIDKESQDLVGVNLYGLEKHPRSFNEVIGILEVVKLKLIEKSNE